MELELAERGRVGGRTGYNFGMRSLYMEGRYDDRRRELLQDEEVEVEYEGEHNAAAAEAELQLAHSQLFVFLDSATISRPELRYGSYAREIGNRRM